MKAVLKTLHINPVSLEIASFLAMTWLFISVSASAQPSGATIDAQHYTFALQLNDQNDIIKGQATVTVKFLKDAGSFKLDLIKKTAAGKGMLVSTVTENGKSIKFSQSDEKLTLSAAAKKASTHNYTITYSGIPADGLIISTNKYGHRTFFGDNWPNRARNWLPCVDAPADKASVEFIVTAPAHYDVVANGVKTEEKAIANNNKLTHWQETAQLPTKVMVIGAADFAIDHSGDVNQIPVYSYVFPEDKINGAKGYAQATGILPFFIEKIGPYAYKKLANVQSKTIFGGMENAGAIFYFENSVSDSGIEELMAHEIAHQWFGDSASEKTWANLWLSEGFATYMTNYYLESKYGQDTLKKRLIAQRTKILNFEKQRLTPVVDTAVKSDYMQLLNANSYEKGGWVLHMLRRRLGDDVFFKGIRNYYEKYKGGNANTDDFRKVMEQASGKDLQQFFDQWLYKPGHVQLSISRTYDAATKQMNLLVRQTQIPLYDLILEYSVDGKLYKKNMIGTAATIQVETNNPKSLVIDPNVNLLGTYEVRDLRTAR
jgi:aminopeptidase N